MGWHTVLVVLLAQRYICPSAGVPHALTLPQSFSEDDVSQDTNNSLDADNLSTLDVIEDVKLQKLGNILAQLLVVPWPKGISPLLYVENFPPELLHDEEFPTDMDNIGNYAQIGPVPSKRMRYYRKYPWKRQNARYDAENRYLCQPSKDDVFRLLVALHEARQGNRGHTVNFCNRKRPATAIFTNIRFLGKRK